MEPIAKPLVWGGIEKLPVHASNQIMIQIDQDQVYLNFGIATPPILTPGSADDLRLQAEQIPFVEVQPLQRLSVSRRHLSDIVDVLQRAITAFDAQGGTE
ncbi:hypothetical protein [Streptomyces sp. NPDC049040]|uniref:hypothetical protein n=1 Tax=Streptomyces sp. NPDC049040 TaxID=3365593 RepID=UPI00371A10B8